MKTIKKITFILLMVTYYLFIGIVISTLIRTDILTEAHWSIQWGVTLLIIVLFTTHTGISNFLFEKIKDKKVIIESEILSDLRKKVSLPELEKTLKDIQIYFESKLLAGDYIIISHLPYDITLKIEEKYSFTLHKMWEKNSRWKFIDYSNPLLGTFNFSLKEYNIFEEELLKKVNIFEIEKELSTKKLKIETLNKEIQELEEKKVW